MKMLKKISATIAAVVMAAAMAISASAATAAETVEAARKAGVQEHNVNQLQNFFDSHPDLFTAEQYDHMIDVLEQVAKDYVIPAAEKLGYDTTDLSKLTETQKIEIGKSWSEEERQAIIKALVDLGAEYGIKIDVDITKIAEEGFDVAVVVQSDEGNEQIPVDPPIGSTGFEGSSTNTIAVVGAGAAVLLAGAGIVVIAKKNKEN